MNLSAWKPRTPAGRLVKTWKITSMPELLDSNLPIKEPEIANFLLGNLIETTLRVINIGSGQYRRKAMVVVTGNHGWTGFGKSCGKNSKIAIAGAARNARLRMFRIPVQSETVPQIISGEYLDIEIFIGPGSEEMVASPMVKFILNLVGIRRGFAISNSEKDSMILIEALIEALREMSNL